MLNPNGGAIALVTTVRLVYSSANQALNDFHGTPHSNRMQTVSSLLLVKCYAAKMQLAVKA
jgi:hypothetical protein